MKNEERFVDAESYQGKGEDKLTFRMIVLETLKKIGTFASVEFRGGYWEERGIPMGNFMATQRQYVSDTREVYSNAVEYLYDILYPHFDSEMKKAGVEAEKRLKEAYDNKTYVIIPDREDENPKESRGFKDNNDKISFRSERRVINRILFREINCFLQRQKYMEGKTFIDEA